MNNLEKVLGLSEIDPIDKIMIEPIANNLTDVPKIKQSYELLLYVCNRDGLALKHASKKLITSELCMVAVRQNGLAIKYIPKRILKMNGKEWYRALCKEAVHSNGKALIFIPDELKDYEMVEAAVLADDGQDYSFIIQNEATLFSSIPKNLLTKDIIIKAVEKNPLSIREIPKNRLSKKVIETAVTGNGLAIKYVPDRYINEKLVTMAISDNPMAIIYVPQEFRSQQLCEECFICNPAVISYLPEKCITKKMCLNIINSDFLSFINIDKKENRLQNINQNGDIVLFDDIPENMRNDKDIIDAIIEKNGYNLSLLIKWNDQITQKTIDQKGALYNKRNEEIQPLHKETIDYIYSKNKGTNHVNESAEKYPIYLEGITLSNTDVIELPLKECIPDSQMLVWNDLENAIVHDYAEPNETDRKVYYVTDIHLEYQLSEEINDGGKQLRSLIQDKIDDLIADVTEHNNILLIGGDIADGISLTACFYHELYRKWSGRLIISVLGNHELWDRTRLTKTEKAACTLRTVDEIIDDYKAVIERCTPYHSGWRSYERSEMETIRNSLQKDERFLESIVLENELFIVYKNKSSRIIGEKEILDSSDEDMTELLEKCTFIVLGGIGFSGLNPIYNAKMGLYSSTITSIDEDIKRTAKYRNVYNKIRRCAENKKVIVLTHTPIYDWSDDENNNNWIYVNGHTHQNSFIRSEADGMILSDNQFGYVSRKWKLNSFTMNCSWYDPFERYVDGIYHISSEQYMEFNRGRGIMSNGCPYDGKLFMIKRNTMYMFLLQSKQNLCILSGGRRKRLQNSDISYYYDNLYRYCEIVIKMIEPYKKVLKRISEEVKRIGGLGIIHGCIVDISFFSHIYINPLDGTITPYYAKDILSRKVFDSILELLEEEEPHLMLSYDSEIKNNTITIIGKKSSPKNKVSSSDIIPRWMFGTDIYYPSRQMRAIQYIWQQHVIRIWNDDVLQTDLEKGGWLLSDKKEKS